ncbi:PREDICTED: serine hydrolase-like protein [Ceratosolen solmsi marchali]|uniref:Serine hydrolase-like protein n=1 Tax=Ceratosolen solmsi marchali TaxID=326594 RepID=A0AAJ7DYG5_9HYME|nr:PREDICTED: serine hydrolase-like protein [Ceratosolen solmsi marchali]
MKTLSTFNLKVPWGHIAVKAWGNIKNTGVLMVHGTLDNAGAFDRLVALLPHDFYYVSIDLPGHGFSSHYQNGIKLSFFTYVLAIKYVLDELQWKHAFYIGHSLGAQLGLFFSLIYPKRIQKLVLIDSIIPELIVKDEIISRIKKEYEFISKKYKQNNLHHYTKEEVMFALKYLRKNCLTSEAAEALFERSVTKVNENSYIYNRDIRAKIFIIPFMGFDQYLHVLNEINGEILILATDTLLYKRHIIFELLNFFKSYNIHVIRIRGNHDVHNNYPERISEHISRFIKHFSSKL